MSEQIIRAVAKAQHSMNLLKEAIIDVLPPPNASRSEALGPTEIARKLGIYQEVQSTPPGQSSTTWTTRQIIYVLLEILGEEGRVQRCENSPRKWERTS